MFTTTSDNAIERWQDGDTEYAVAVDDTPQCPAGDWIDGRNCARRVGDSTWFGDTSVLDGEHEIARIAYNGHDFEGAAKSRGDAEFIVQPFAHWAEGDVYMAGKESPAGTQYVGGIYTADGLPPSLTEVKTYF